MHHTRFATRRHAALPAATRAGALLIALLTLLTACGTGTDEPSGTLSIARADDITISSLLDGETVTGTITIAFDTHKNVDEVHFHHNGDPTPLTIDTSAPFELQLDTSGLADGPHTITAHTPVGNSGSTREIASADFTVANSTTTDTGTTDGSSEEDTTTDEPTTEPTDEPTEVDGTDDTTVDDSTDGTTTEGDTEEGVTAPAPAEDRAAMFIVGSPSSLNRSESAIRDRLENDGWSVAIVHARDVTTSSANGHDLVLMSKTITSTDLGDVLHGTTTGVLFWEDNQQMLGMMATVDNDGSSTAWHNSGSSVYLLDSAPSALRASLPAGTTPFLTQKDEITYGPGVRAGTVTSDAIQIARLDSDSTKLPIYAYEAGTKIADGTNAAGRRVYFGLYDNTFRYLTSDGLELWDAVLEWAATSKS